MEFHLTLAERHDLTGQIYRQLRAAIIEDWQAAVMTKLFEYGMCKLENV
ncbi:hypothetical protein AB0756_38070 [Tolypothrix campylonemoides VB511288_2]|uniref:GntR family transcriptional regulator n=3 Tax=Cyanophyceae TaxID=3028117 RepID=A0ABW8WZH1_9CYAN